MGILGKGLLLTTGLGAIGLYNLAGPAYRNFQDLQEAVKLKQDAENTITPTIGAALGGLALGGLGGFAATKLLASPGRERLSYGDTKDKLRSAARILTGKTGMEGEEAYQSLMAERAANRAESDRINAMLPAYAKYSYLRNIPYDKRAGTLGGALAAGTLISGAFLANHGAYLLERQHMINQYKLKQAEKYRSMMVPGAALAGTLLGGLTGAALGKASAGAQTQALNNDIYAANAERITAANLRRKEQAYTQAHNELARQYLAGERV